GRFAGLLLPFMASVPPKEFSQAGPDGQDKVPVEPIALKRALELIRVSKRLIERLGSAVAIVEVEPLAELSFEHVDALARQRFDVGKLHAGNLLHRLGLALSQVKESPQHDPGEERQQRAADVQHPDHDGPNMRMLTCEGEANSGW